MPHGRDADRPTALPAVNGDQELEACPLPPCDLDDSSLASLTSATARVKTWLSCCGRCGGGDEDHTECNDETLIVAGQEISDDCGEQPRKHGGGGDLEPTSLLEQQHIRTLLVMFGLFSVCLG